MVKLLSIYKENDYSYVLCVGGAKEVLFVFRLMWLCDKMGVWDFKFVVFVILKLEDKLGM